MISRDTRLHTTDLRGGRAIHGGTITIVPEATTPDGREVDGPVGGLPLTAVKEQFSIGFVHLVVAAAGYWIKRHDTDYDGVDVTIVSSSEWRTYYCPEFELQVKCTSQHGRLSPDCLTWAMDAGPYKKLTHPKRYTKAYLAVLLVPHDAHVWLAQDEDWLLTESRMYWVAASDLEPIEEGAASKTIRLPRSNLFDVEQLHGIMQSVGDGGGI